jgi:hypothetical protein
MGLTALQPQSEPKTTPRSTEWCESGQQGPWQTVVPFHKLVCSIICAASSNRNEKHQTSPGHPTARHTQPHRDPENFGPPKGTPDKSAALFCRFLKLGVSNAFVIDEAQLEFKMRTQTRLEKISTAISLFGMAMGFSLLGFLIVVNQHDGGASIPGGIFGILLGAAFLIAACLHLKRQIQGGFRLEEIPAEIVPEMRQAPDAICGF